MSRMSTYHTNIHSCRSFPCESCFGQTSKKRYMSFLSAFDLLGMTNRIMCMSSPAWGSPLSIMERIFFCRVVRSVNNCLARRQWESPYHSLNLGLVGALLQSLLELILRGNIRRVVLMDLYSSLVSSLIYSTKLFPYHAIRVFKKCRHGCC